VFGSEQKSPRIAKNLHLALSTLGVELEVLNKQFGGKLRWACDDAGGLGFPGFSSYP